ncbi:hypothetical protein [Streptomyces sp. TLI_171]|uniref:hypothetical protein n=1 Tax=Streptomyces sp. TLI_171 TaxID=1938859 RepID=UPI001180EB64|nr:hypothetical protein [Streptomyces sp. TLI_171]
MIDSTPYDEQRAEYSREALARLVVSDRARTLSDAAGAMVQTQYDEFEGPGGKVSEAAQLIEQARELLAAAVVHERERGSSWGEIAQYLGVDADTAELRHADAVTGWRTAFEVPYRLDGTGRKRIPQLPAAAYDPQWALRSLDAWVARHTGYQHRHAVSEGLERRTGRLREDRRND